MLTICAANVSAQKEDYIWLSGYNAPSHPSGYGINRLDFNYSPRHVTLDDSIAMNFQETNVCFSDTGGHILFYSNGGEIHNKWDEVIGNSRYMSEGYLLDHSTPRVRTSGVPDRNALMALREPGSNGQYIFFQCFVDTNIGNTTYFVNKLLSTHLSMTDSSGHGKVLFRDSLILKDTMSWTIAACRHANGKDWWIFVQEVTSNCYNRLLLDSTGVHVIGKACSGVVAPFNIGNYDFGIGCFSPDGTKYANIHYLSGLSLYDFDRCSGTLSNPRNYPIPNLYTFLWELNGVAFSPNSRYLYASITEYVFQYDTWTDTFLTHPDTIGHYDGFSHPQGSYYGGSQLAPDGKIYIATENNDMDYSVIDSPDMPGIRCHFMPHGLLLPAYAPGPPNNPNYRLGKQIGGPCDTLNALMEVNTSQLDVRIFPNPAQDFFMVDYGLADWSRHESLGLKLTDLAGQIVYSASLSRYSALHRVHTAALSSGMYLVEILDSDGRVLSVRKVVKEE